MFLVSYSIALLIFSSEVSAIKCKNCYSYNNQACVNAPDCESDICLYEQLNSANGVVHTLKTCYTKGDSYQFDDSATMSNKNQCVTRTTKLGQYYVSLCTSTDYCNLDCRTEADISTTTQIVPIPLGTVTCYECSTSDGTDCQTNTCQGAYCLYERRLVGNQMYMKKGCVIEPYISLDDNTVVQSVDICEVRNTASSRYYVKICNDLDYCNNYCNPGQTPTLPPIQKQPLVTCYECESAIDCFTGSCQGNYCLYEKQQRVGSKNVYYRKTCSTLSYAEFPDKSTSNAVNQCETRVINDVQYNVKFCNNANHCNRECFENRVSCTECYAQNQEDCTGNTCEGNYCLFVREISQLDSSKSFVRKSCSSTDVVNFSDNTSYSDFGHCQYKNIGSVQHMIKLCDSSYCNTACANIPLPTPSPSSDAPSTTWKSSVLLLFLVLILGPF